VKERKKQPYRAPVVHPFFRDGTPDYLEECLAPAAIEKAGVWAKKPVESLIAKCRRTKGESMSNTDDMSFCAVLSTQLIARDLIFGARLESSRDAHGKLGVDVDRVRDGGGR
jgi:asparagine synthase (glutamine-hydrolysing)